MSFVKTDDEAIAPAGKLGDRPSVHREYTSDIKDSNK
jgi:hypothetical protein